MKRLLDVRTPMRDGIELSCDIWLPDEVSRHPLILLRTPYLKVSPPSAPVQVHKLALFFVQHGYAVAVQDVRGRGDSDGHFRSLFQEGEDGFDTIEWMAAQSWCDGRVGTMGVSYSGALQWLAARHVPPHLVCMATTASPGDFLNEVPYIGGAFLQNRLWWANLVSGRIFQSNIGDDEWAEIFAHRPLITADEVMGRRIPLYREWLQHPTLDQYWRPLRLEAEDYRRICVPALHVTGWFDSNQAGALYHWRGMAQSSPAAQDQYLIVGPWDHAQTFFGGTLKMGEMEFTQDSVIDVLQVHLDFFDRYLKGSRASFDYPRARLYVTGINEWRMLESYPSSELPVRKLHLASGGRLIERPNESDSTDAYLYDPRDPVPLDPFAFGAMYGVDRRTLESRQDMLVYTGEVLTKAIEVIGQPEVELFAASDARDTDFTASLLDVYPDGRSVVLGSRVVGIRRARYRKGLVAEELLRPGRTEAYRIDLGHIAHVFKTGHRIRVEISSSAAPYYNPNQNTGNPVATDTEWRIAHQTIHHDAAYPSALLLPGDIR